MTGYTLRDPRLEPPEPKPAPGAYYCVWCDEPIPHDTQYLETGEGVICASCVSDNMQTAHYDW